MKTISITLITLIILLLTLTTTTAANIETNNTTIKLTINSQEATAHMINNPTSDEFLQLLPLELDLKDLFGREKYAQLPKELTSNTPRISTYDVGYIAYYEPTNSIAIYYDDDNEEISEGIIPIAIIDNNTDIFKENNTHVKIEIN
ncbi:MAG: hypothetical protein E7Z84_03890 [Methanosphaera stadtmanae]|nr:hypothetical protein [Methanosphaera stadtmanae]